LGRNVDPVALVIGSVFLAAAIIVLVGRSLFDDGRFLVPVGLIALGLSLLVSGRSGEDSPGHEIRTEGGEDGQV
jgi:hypothetical protein